MTRIKLAIATVLSLAFTSLAAQDFQKGSDAFENDDFATALEEWLPLAEQGEPGAQAMLGMMYKEGLGTPKDMTKSLLWFRLAAGQGIAPAQNELGVLHLYGQGVLQDYALSFRWFKLAADQGNASAQSNLGVLFESGYGVLQDNIMAHMWYNIASANGNEKASEWRDERAGLMTPADISTAQTMASECMNSGYQNCGY